jgi:signal transduction histidine kinase
MLIRDYEFYSDSSFSELGIEEILENNLSPVPVLPMKLQQIFDNLLRNAEQVIRVSKRSERLLTLISVPNKNLAPRFRSICSLSYNQINAEWRE